MAKTQVKNYVFKPGLGAADNLFPNAYSLINANKPFIQKEATAWIAEQVAADAAGFINYSYNQEKCERDIGYVIDAYLKDLRYNGNENTIKTIHYYWDQGVAQIDGDRQPEIQTHTFIGNLIKNNILPKVPYDASNEEISQILTGDDSETALQFTPVNANYNPTTGVMTLTIGTHSLSAGNEIFIAPGGISFTRSSDNATIAYPREFGNQISGKDSYYYSPLKILSTTDTTITFNVGTNDNTSSHTFASATTNSVTSGPVAKINTLAFNTVDVITTGLPALPVLAKTGVGTIKIQGKHDLDELLLITNVTANEIIYNFAQPSTGGLVSLKTDGINIDEDFPKYLQTTDGITTITLNYNTEGHNATDELQVFVEKLENGKSVVTTRPFDFGTDAIERTRVAPAVSMLDADFEYGLQPTKWAAIGTLRGYPSVYEIPGTDTPVLSVVSDASTGTEGIGQSLITVTTVSAHGFEAGTPITIKALEDAVVGAARAEGSFVIVAVPTPNTFTYFAKSKVGTSNPSTLSTTYTQLRQAGFYTGATIGSPDFQVISQGSNGVMEVQLGVETGNSIIPFDGAAPEIGSPLTVNGIPTGAQVTGIIDNSAGGGTYITPVITENAAAGATEIVVEDTTGVVTSLAADRGDGVATYINSVSPTSISFDDGFTAPTTANKRTYAGLTGSNVQGQGINATFDVTLTSNAQRDYSVTVNNGGLGYEPGDKILLDGVTLGGQSGPNDLAIIVSTIGLAGDILTFTQQGQHWDGTLNIIGQTANIDNHSGTGALFDIEFDAGAYTTVVPALGVEVYNNPLSIYNGAAGTGIEFDITRNGASYSLNITATGADYAATETIDVPGSFLGGSSPANDATITIDAVGASGEVLTTTITGTANNLSDQSAGYAVYDGLLILGSEIPNGNDGVNDIYVQVTSVDVSGAITGVTFAGTPPIANREYNGVNSIIPATYSGTTGSNAIFQVNAVNGFYGATIQVAGIDYVPTETFTVLGTDLGGVSPGNDLTITIDNVSGTGEITEISATGTASTSGEAAGLTSTNRPGNASTFDITIVGGNYNVTLNNPGQDYGANQTLTVPGNVLAGQSPANDLTITITSIDTVVDGAITGISSTGTVATPGGTYSDVGGTNLQPIGTGAEFDINRLFTAYDSIVITQAGANYAVGDRIEFAGTSFDGISPENDILLSVSSIGPAGEIASVSYEGTAVYGSNLDLISTVSMSEVTTAPLTIGTIISYSALATIEATFDNAHGLVPGSTFITSIDSENNNNHDLVAGSYIATDIPTTNKLRFQVRAPGSIDISLSQILGSVYPRPDSFFIHRPFDGGVQLGTGGPQHGAQAIRQSKKYIRYQSGKGIMYTTGALFAPSYDIRSAEAEDVEVGSLITIVTDDNDHGLQVGGIVRLLGIETPGYNSGPQTAVPPKFDYEVVEIVDERTFKVRSQRRLGATSAVLGFGAQMSVISWHGATVRSGIFDDQNGIFWEFDGTQISVVQRTGTQQLAGTISLDVDSNLIFGNGTRFEDQLKAGDRIIIKGMTHVVSHVNNDTSCTVTPDFRGVVNIVGAKANLVIDKKVKQREFNLDTLDGTGPSGYDIDIAKMQMIGIQYSWYGAGFIDFMLRGSDGNFVFAHRMRNSNVNTEAFMRSGNLPVRYEVTNEGPSGKLAEEILDTATELTLEDSSFFPYSGTIYIDNEIITFTGKDDSKNRLLGLNRGATFTNFQAGAQRQYTAGPAVGHTARTGVILISQTITPLISHWGSAFITDGGFDDDRGYIFSYAETSVPVSTTKQTAFMIRLSPSVSNALIGDLGERELLNRAQLLLQGLEVTSDGTDGTGNEIKGGIVVEGILNPQNYPLNPVDVGWTGLSGLAQGGQPSFAQIASGGSVVWSSGDVPTTSTATAQSNITNTFQTRYNSGSNRNYVYARRDSWEASGGAAGDFIISAPGASWGSGIRISRADGPYSSGGNAYYVIRLDGRYSGNVNGGQTLTLERRFTVEDRNIMFLNKSSFDASGARTGTTVSSGGSINTSANTLISSIALRDFNSIEYYEITLNNTFSGTLTAGSGTVEFTFVQPPYAQPGETVFSFIANPGERSMVDFSELKELTNTPLGGRGTYPNGPDVLAINVYKVSGVETNANLILRWGEAQA